MKKKIKYLYLILLPFFLILVIFSFNSCAANDNDPTNYTSDQMGKNWKGYKGGYLTIEFDDDNSIASVISNHLYSSDNLIIPRFVKKDDDQSNKKYKLIIDDYAFYNNDTIVNKVTLPTKSYIGKFAFSNCVSITYIYTNEVAIDENAFKGCNNLVVFELDAGSIGHNAFMQCEKLSTIRLGNEVVSVSDDAFLYCDNITNVNIDMSVIPDNLFNNKIKLDKLSIGKNVRVIGKYAFANTAIITLEIKTDYSNKLLIDDYAFSNNTKLKYIDLWCEIIGNEAFANCPILDTIAMHDGLKKINDYAFYSTLIRNPMFPTTLEYVGKYAFSNSGVVDIRFSGSTQHLVLDESSFESCSNLAFITVTSRITINSYAFKECDAITKIDLAPNGQSVISNYAFQDCAISGRGIKISINIRIDNDAFSPLSISQVCTRY